MLRSENLIIDEIYYKNDFIFKHVGTSPYKCNNTALDIKSKRLYKDNAAMDTYNKSPERLATDEEKAWLQHCIKEDKFIEYEEFMKVYKPQFIVGQWYKIELYHKYNHFIKFKSFDTINGYINDLGYIENLNRFKKGNYVELKNITKYELVTDLSEIQNFLPQDHPDKQLDIKQIQEECKRRFPIGCKFRCANTKNESILRQDEIVYEINDSYIYASGSQGCLYYEGKYAELIEAPEVIVPEYVEYIDTLYKGKIVKVEDWCCGSYCKVVFYNGNKEQPFKHLVKTSTKSAYELQNLKQQPLTPEQCYNTEIEVGDYIQYEDKEFYTVESNNPVNLFHHNVNKSHHYCQDLKHLNNIKKFKIIKKAFQITKQVDFSSPKVTNTLYIKPRNQTTVVITEEKRTRLKLNYSKTIKTKQHVN